MIYTTQKSKENRACSQLTVPFPLYTVDTERARVLIMKSMYFMDSPLSQLCASVVCDTKTFSSTHRQDGDIT